MNRAQRRQMNRENGTEVKSLTYTLKASDIQKIKDDAAREAVDSLEKTSYRLAGIDGGEVAEEVVTKLAKDVKRMEERKDETDKG